MAQFDPFADPRTAGILGMGSALLEASGPSKLPITIGQAMGAGLQRGLLERSRAEEVATQKMLRETQAKKMQEDMARQQYLRELFNQIKDPQERLFAQLNPEAWVKSKLDRAADPKPFGAPEAGYHIIENGQSRQLVPPVAKKEKPTSDEALLIAAGYTPGTPEYQAAARELLKKKSEFAPPITVQNYPNPIAAIPPGKTEPELVQFGNKGGAQATGFRPAPSRERQMPPAITKAIADEVEEVGIAASTDADLGAIRQQVETGQIKLGPVNNLISQARNIAGVSNEQSRNFQSLKATLEKLRNDSLRLNKGVQTEGDAQRAWNELLANITDENVVKQRLAEIQAINKRAVELRQLKIETLKSPYGGDTDGAGQRAAQQPAAVGSKQPAKGDVIDGWEFIGGDPANRMNWRKAK